MSFRLLLFGIVASTLVAQDSNDKIWNGVFNSAQADRGKASYAKECSNCHNADLNGSARAPALHGDRFLSNWINGSVNTLFTKIRFSMPATYPETVADDVKLDIVAYLLQANEFPAGANELKMNADELDGIQIVKKGASEIPNFVLVQVVGCLAQGPGNAWTLTKTTSPVTTRDETPTAAALKDAGSKALGNQTFVLVSVGAFHPGEHKGQKVEARGLLYREPNENRLNLTSLQTASQSCK